MTEKPLQLINVSHTKSCPRSVKFFKNGISKLKKVYFDPVRLLWSSSAVILSAISTSVQATRK